MIERRDRRRLVIRKNTEEMQIHRIELPEMQESDVLFVAVDYNGNVIQYNQSFQETIKRSKERLEDSNIFDVILFEDQQKMKQIMQDKQNRGKLVGIDVNFVSSKYENIYVIGSIECREVDVIIKVINITKYALVNKDKEQINSLYYELASSEEEIQRRFEELGLKQKELERSEQRYSAIVETASMGIWELDFENNQYFASPKLQEIVGYSLGENSEEFMRYVHPEDCIKLRRINNECRDGIRDGYDLECRVMHSQKGYIWIYIICKWVRDAEGNVIRVAGSVTDINEKKKTQEKIRYMAYFDQLTQLTNKNYLATKYENIKDSESALLCIDITNFKVINDSFGYNYGDMTLKEIARRLKTLKEKNCVISRVGTTEFAIFIKQFQNEIDITDKIEQIKALFVEPVQLNDMIYEIMINIGVAIAPKDGKTFEELMRHADIAVHRARARGNGKVIFFDHKFRRKILDKIRIESDLRRALANNEFELYYQPQTDMKENKIKGFEALIRWIKPDGTIISPADFIPVAEDSGLIIPIGEWVIKQACLTLKELQDKGYDKLYIAVNVSSVQLGYEKFIKVIDEIVNMTRIKPSNLHIEITETILMERIEENIEKINEIKERGIRIALDDFGKGYSSLTYLQQLPIDVLKIEKAFIDDIIQNIEKNITGAIINLGHELELEVVAEGVEEVEQVNYLRKWSCDLLQGYLISRPIPKKEIYQLLNKYK